MLGTVLEVRADDRDFSSGALPDLARAIGSVSDGELVGVTGSAPRLRADLALWSRLTGHGLVEVRELPGGSVRFVVRKGLAAFDPSGEAGPGDRLWIYSNFNCNLACDYCCVRSSPHTSARVLSVESVRLVAGEARELAFRRIFVTGGEPFLHPDPRGFLLACAEQLPTTVLTNGSLLSGPRGEILSSLPQDRLTLQISLDSPTPAPHDQHRGPGSWERAWTGVERARKLGYRVRIAATIADEDDRRRMAAWLEEQGVAPADQVLRPVARRGAATSGVVLARGDLVPEITVTAQGVYWHPVGADDDDFLVCRPLGRLRDATAAVQSLRNAEREVERGLAQVFHCA